AIDVGARVELELGDEVAPVGWQRLERRLPLGRERRPRDLLRRLGLARPDERQFARDPLRVDSAEQSPSGLGSDPVPAARDIEADGVAGEAWTGRSEQRSGAFPRLLGVDPKA